MSGIIIVLYLALVFVSIEYIQENQKKNNEVLYKYHFLK